MLCLPHPSNQQTDKHPSLAVVMFNLKKKIEEKKAQEESGKPEVKQLPPMELILRKGIVESVAVQGGGRAAMGALHGFLLSS